MKQKTQRQSVRRYTFRAFLKCLNPFRKRFIGTEVEQLKFLFEKAIEELEQTERDYSGAELIHEILEGK